MSAAMASVKAAWGEEAPAWIVALAEEADRTTQARAARRIGYSAGTVNGVLRGSYRGDLVAVQKAVEGALMAATVDCPVLGEVGTQECLRHQRQPFATTNPLRVRLYRACRAGCRHSRLGAPHE